MLEERHFRRCPNAQALGAILEKAATSFVAAVRLCFLPLTLSSHRATSTVRHLVVGEVANAHIRTQTHACCAALRRCKQRRHINVLCTDAVNDLSEGCLALLCSALRQAMEGIANFDRPI